MASPPNTDRNLLFGILALQMDFIGRDALIRAMSAWTLEKYKSLGQILQEQGTLAAAERDVLEALVEKHLEHHGNDPRRSLAAAATPSAVQPVLSAIRDDEVQASLSSLFSTPDTELEVSTVNEVRTGAVRYEILRPHAKGGLGEVFVALDRELQREVALKEIRKERADEVQSRGRFLLEAEITGGLEHPGVVPVYGLGQYADGRPFYAMRLIKGETLKDALQRYHDAADQPGARSRELQLRTLLTRFIAVCNTVAYAHSRGVLHRDLKPANIMLGKYGETLVIDWGLAKSIGRPESAAVLEEQTLRPSSGSNLAATQAGAAVGTPAYMSPEQAAGKWDLVDPTSDIYSLGATLYTLLTGAVPVRGTDPADILQKVLRGDYPPPRQMSPEVPPALEAVCRKAMALSPGDRYGTALELAAEIERWLADEPVLAWPEPTLARMGRWVRRHRTGVAGALTALAVAAVCLGAATGLLLAANAEARHQREIADQQRDRAAARFKLASEAVDHFYRRALESKNLWGPGMEQLRSRLLESAISFSIKLLDEEPENTDVRAEQGRSYRRLAVLSASLGNTERARENDEKALAIFDRLIAEYPNDPKFRLDRIVTIANQGMLNHRAGRSKPAEERWKQALTECQALLAEHPNETDYRSQLATLLNNLGSLNYMRGDFKAATDFYEQVLSATKLVAEAEPDNLKYQLDLSDSYSNLGLVNTALGKNTEAEEAFKQALAIQRPLQKAHPEEPDYQLALARTENSLGNLYSNTSQPRRAIEVFERAKTLQLLLTEKHPLVLEYQLDLAASYNNLGDSYTDIGQPERAIEEYRQSEKLCQRLLQVQPENLEFEALLGGAQAGEALAFAEAGKIPEALDQYAKAMEKLRAILKKEPRQIWAKTYSSEACLGRASLLARQGRKAEAEQDLKESERLGQSREEAKYRIVHAQVLARAGDYNQAIAEADAAAKETVLTGRALYLLASAYAQCAGLAKEDAPLAVRAEAGATAALDRARGEGYFQSVLMVERLKRDPDFATLRESKGFRKIMTAIEAVKPSAK